MYLTVSIDLGENGERLVFGHANIASAIGKATDKLFERGPEVMALATNSGGHSMAEPIATQTGTVVGHAILSANNTLETLEDVTGYLVEAHEAEAQGGHGGDDLAAYPCSYCDAIRTARAILSVRL